MPGDEQDARSDRQVQQNSDRLRQAESEVGDQRIVSEKASYRRARRIHPVEGADLPARRRHVVLEQMANEQRQGAAHERSDRTEQQDRQRVLRGVRGP